MIMKFINDSMYWHGKGKISSCLSGLLPEVLDCAPARILTIFFCKVKIFTRHKFCGNTTHLPFVGQNTVVRTFTDS